MNKLNSIIYHGLNQIGVYLGSTAVVFNLPNPCGTFPNGGPAFEPEAPRSFWAATIGSIIKEKFAKDDAIESLIACTFSQNANGSARIEHLARWDLGPALKRSGKVRPIDLEGALLDPNKPPLPVKELQRLLALNMANGPFEVAPKTFSQPFGVDKKLTGVLANRKFTAVLRLGDVRLDLDSITSIDALANKRKYSPLANPVESNRGKAGMVYWMASAGCGDGNFFLGFTQAKKLVEGAKRMADDVRLFSMRNSPFRFDDPNIQGVLDLMSQAAEERNEKSMSQPSWHPLDIGAMPLDHMQRSLGDIEKIRSLIAVGK